MCTLFGLSSMASDGSTWCLSPAVDGLTCVGADQVAPPSAERTNRMFECPAGSPKNGLVELDHARYSVPLRAAKAGCRVIRDALMYLGKPNRPGPGFAVP